MLVSSFQISGMLALLLARVLALLCHGCRGASVLVVLALLLSCATAHCSPCYCRVLLLA
jgi:hypothetical protein